MTLTLCTDRGNYVSLKVLAAASVTNTRIEIENVIEVTKRLPILSVSKETKIFSSNAAVRYLFQKAGISDENSSEIDSLLEWEASQLQSCVLPYLVSKLVSNKQDQDALTRLIAQLKYLDGLLTNKQFLLKDTLTAADVSVWATVYPVLSEPSLRPDEPFPNVARWLEGLNRRPEFQAAVLTVTGGNGVESMKESLSKMPLPPVSGKSPQPAAARSKSGPVDSKPTPEQGEVEDASVSQAELDGARDSWLTGRQYLPAPREQKHPKQPIPGERNILITAALPYVNNVPHLGNIIGCVLSADVFSRFCRMRNYNCLYLCGTDEYGTATETKALAEGITPAEICEKYNKLHTQVYKWFNIDFDYFGRTTTEWQTKISQDIFWKLYDNGYVLKDAVEQLKCETCNRFLADRFVEGTCPLCRYEDARGDQCDGCGKLLNATDLIEPRCKLCSKAPTVKSSDHLFLDLPVLTEKLSAFLETRFTESGLWSANAKLITKSWIRDGLKPRCITRDLKWGTPVPLEGYTDKVFYVWFDAPIGYLSIGANYHEEWEKWWKNPEQVELFHFLGKDNVPFHSVIFPASLIGADDNYTLVSHISATEYLNYEDTKFSKSRGTGVFGNDASDTQIPADIWRFYLLFVRPESQDSSFSWDDFMLKNNSELLNNLGNFINRALMFLSNYFDATVPEMILEEDDYVVLAQITKEIQGYIDDLEHLRLRDALRKILNITRVGNQFMQANQPWVLVKGSADDKSRAGTVVGLAANISCLVSVLLQPYMPEVSATIQSQLAAPSSCNYIADKFVCHLPRGHKIGKPSPLFAKLDAKLIEELKKKYAGQQRPAQSAEPAGDAGAVAAKENGVAASSADGVDVEALNALISEQGNIVRELKTAKADKDVISAEVQKLLALKKQLPASTGASGAPPESAAGGKKKKNKKR